MSKFPHHTTTHWGWAGGILYTTLRSPRRRRRCKERRPSRRNRSSYGSLQEILYKPRPQPLDLLQTISVGNKVRRAELPKQRVIKGSKRGHGQFNKRPPYHKQYPSSFGGSFFAMDGGGEGSVHENAQAFNNACDLSRININKLLKVIEICYQ